MKNYILSVCAVSLFCYLCHALSAGHTMQKNLWYVSTLLLALVLFSPLVSLDADFLEETFSAYHAETEDWEEQTEEAARQALEDSITSRCEAYILEQAGTRNLSDLDLEFHFSKETYSLAPVSVTIWASCSGTTRQYLEAIIEQNLGIPKERQIWQSKVKTGP